LAVFEVVAVGAGPVLAIKRVVCPTGVPQAAKVSVRQRIVIQRERRKVGFMGALTFFAVYQSRKDTQVHLTNS
jgi:hypothetical protein